jgi:Transglutaminase-like superfamily
MRRYIAPPLTPPNIYLRRIPRGYQGTKRTVEHIKALIRSGAKDFFVRQKAIDIILERNVTPKDYRGEIKALFEWVQQNVRYTKDPFRVEVLHSARRMLALRAGDCDDMTILLGAMLEAIGHPVRIVLAGPDPLQPRLFTHVYLEAYDRGHWIPLDPTMPYPMGWALQGLVKEVITMEGRGNSVSWNPHSQEATSAPVPDWLVGLMGAIQSTGMQPKDARVKALWNLLQQRQLLGRNRWLPLVLRRIWSRGLTARPLPRTANRIERLLRRWAILPPPATSQAAHPTSIQPLGRVTVQALQPVTVRPVAAVTMQPMTARARRP